jgi:FkbM family methyltransferase
MKDNDYDAFLREALPTERLLTFLFSRNRQLVIFDIGACEGEDSIRYARLFPQAKVFSFEPLPENQSLIRRHFARLGMEACELVPLALSDRRGEAVLHISSGEPENKTRHEGWNYGNKSSSLLPPGKVNEIVPWLKFEKTQTVPTDTLDDFCTTRNLKRVDFLHMDVQGSESLVLEGARQTLPGVTAVWLEVADKEVYQGQKLRGDIELFMQGIGFALVYESIAGTEGDQFYVNTRFWRGRLQVRMARLKRTIKKVLVAPIRSSLQRWRFVYGFL